jgi:hypothetical protein
LFSFHGISYLLKKLGKLLDVCALKFLFLFRFRFLFTP